MRRSACYFGQLGSVELQRREREKGGRSGGAATCRPGLAAALGLCVTSVDVAPVTSIANRCRYEQLNLSPDAALAPNVEARSERLSALPHALQTPVPRAPAFERLRVDPYAIVAHSQAKLRHAVVELCLYAARARVLGGVPDSLSGDAIDLISYERRDCTGTTLYKYVVSCAPFLAVQG